MSANRLLSLPALQPPYSPNSVQKTDSTTIQWVADLVRAADRVEKTQGTNSGLRVGLGWSGR
eukprot:5411202-Pyramimonas_sp.AAC.1